MLFLVFQLPELKLFVTQVIQNCAPTSSNHPIVVRTNKCNQNIKAFVLFYLSYISSPTKIFIQFRMILIIISVGITLFILFHIGFYVLFSILFPFFLILFLMLDYSNSVVMCDLLQIKTLLSHFAFFTTLLFFNWLADPSR